MDVLRLGAVDVRLGVAGARFFADVFRHEGGPVVEAVAVVVHVEHGVQVADVDGPADGWLFFPSQGAAVLYVFVLDGLFGFEGGVVAAFVVKGADEPPFHAGLFDVGEGLPGEGAVAVDDEAVFEVGECFPFGGAFLRQVGHEVAAFGITAFPDAFGKGEGAGVEGVLFDDAFVAAQGSVAPDGHDGTECPVVAFRDAARLLEPYLVDAGLAVHPVEVEAVAVDVAAGGRQGGSRFVFTPAHGDSFRIGRVAGVPDDGGFSMAPDGFDSFGDEFRHGDAYFVGADMEPRTGEERRGFFDDVFDDFKAAFALHGGAHGFGEGFAVAGHVDFRDDLDVEPGAVVDDVAQFVPGVVLAGSAGGPVVFGAGELRVFVALDAPGRVVREVEVKGVDFVAGEVADECFDEVRGEVVAAYVEHEAPEAEGRRVFDAAVGDDGCAAMAEDELAECLQGVEVSGEVGGGDFDPTVRCDGECIAFLRDFSCRSGAEDYRESLGRGGCGGER